MISASGKAEALIIKALKAHRQGLNRLLEDKYGLPMIELATLVENNTPVARENMKASTTATKRLTRAAVNSLSKKGKVVITFSPTAWQGHTRLKMSIYTLSVDIPGSYPPPPRVYTPRSHRPLPIKYKARTAAEVHEYLQNMPALYLCHGCCAKVYTTKLALVAHIITHDDKRHQPYRDWALKELEYIGGK